MSLIYIDPNSFWPKEHYDIWQRLKLIRIHSNNSYCEWDGPSSDCITNARKETLKIIKHFQKFQIPYKHPGHVFSDDRNVIQIAWYKKNFHPYGYVILNIRPDKCWLWVSENFETKIDNPYYYSLEVFFNAWKAFVIEDENFPNLENFQIFQRDSKIIEDLEYDKIISEFPSTIRKIKFS